MPPFEVARDQEFQRFARECRIVSALHDPHIVRALDFGIEGSDPYLVMEYVDGESLRRRLARQGKLPEAEAVRLIRQVGGALGRAHSRGLVHRNVTPDTILITPDGQAKLTDLGLVKQVENEQALTRDGAFLGTPTFVAPEQFFNAGKASKSGDVYALAATLYMAVTGELPFGDAPIVDILASKRRGDLPSPKELVPGLSATTDLAIRRAMSVKPESRPASCEEFVEALNMSAASADVEEVIEEVIGLHEILEPDEIVAAPESNESIAARWPLVLLVSLGLLAGFLAGLFVLTRLL